MAARGIEASDLEQGLARHRELLLERFAEHEARVLDALSRAVGSQSSEPWRSSESDAHSARCCSNEREVGRPIRTPLSPNVLWDGPRVRREGARCSGGLESSDRPLENAWMQQGSPRSVPWDSTAAPAAIQSDHEAPEKLNPPAFPPTPAAHRSSLEGHTLKKGSTPSSLAEFEQPVQPAVPAEKRGSALGSLLSNAATGFYGTVNADAIDQSSVVANHIKELIDAESDIHNRPSVHHRVSGYTRASTSLLRRSFMSMVGHWISKKARRMLGSPYFEVAIVVLILFNAMSIGYRANDAANDAMRSPQHGTPLTFQVLELLFLGAFAFELAVRIVAEKAFFCSRFNVNLKWNVFDFVVVLAGISDAIFLAIAADAPTVSSIRLIRILRLVRILRILRIVKFFSAFRVMVTGIFGSLKVLSFAVMLLTLIIYVFAVVILQFAVEEIEDTSQGQGTLGPDDYEALLHHFDSLPNAIFSLYASILGGIDWSAAAAPLMALNPVLGGLFMLYIAFAVLCVLNIVTGVFCENANKITSQDEGRALLSQLSRKKEWLSEAIKLFKAHDVDGSGKIAWEEFLTCASDVKVQAWFRKVGVDVETDVIQSLWELLDYDGDGQVDVDEFIMTLQQIHGQARSIDMARLKFEVRQIRKRMDMCLERAEDWQARPSRRVSLASNQSGEVAAPQPRAFKRGPATAKQAGGVPRMAAASPGVVTEGIEEIYKEEPVVDLWLPGTPEGGARA